MLKEKLEKTKQNQLEQERQRMERMIKREEEEAIRM